MSRWFCPGRIEVLGKHTDYAGGHTLVCAIDRGTTVTATDSPDERWSAHSEPFEPVDDLLGAELEPGHWARYPQAVVRRLLANFGPTTPMTLSVTSDLPPASGMSSSSALVVATALAVAEQAGFDTRPEWTEQLARPVDLATYLACIENGQSFGTLTGDAGVGTFGGSEDHTAMVCSEPGQLGLFSFCPTVHLRSVPFPADLAFVVAVSGVAAEKTGAALADYNRASLGVRELLARWQADGRPETSLAEAMRSAPDAAARFGQSLADDEDLRRRLAHFVEESEHLVPAAAEALASGDLPGFGRLVAQSQTFAELALRNQVPATSDLAASALRLGALASTSFGAGFGGSVWALMPTGQADDFASDWLADHQLRHPDLTEASTLVVRPSGPARRVD